MTARPIIFSAPMIRALLEGRKTQTRRIVKPQPTWIEASSRWRWPIPERLIDLDTSADCVTASHEWHWYRPDGCCPYGDDGDVLWVRETWGYCIDDVGDSRQNRWPVYRADHDSLPSDNGIVSSWRPSIHMPRWASRLTLRITGVRVQRLREISISDAIAEGYDGSDPSPIDPSIVWYADLWRQIHGPESWDANPWVWALTFEVIHKNVDEVRE